MIKTTVYNPSNAVSTGYYHTYKGERVQYEYIGTEQECIDMYDLTFNHPDCDHETTHVIERINVRTATPVHHTNPLFSAWNSPVHHNV